ncbi:TPA: aldo/keto reductase [Legionella pneumophila]|uniref:aldo/keto reductase family protein n=1 Tax=Legionella sp. PATHC039 TaxID=2992042 RepID=UPI0007782ED8|nr:MULTISPECIES: aldo/keto reductase [Legionella]HAT8859835.1 aldo/keto reductase [Legionella pneumophila subsp. pneumophila]MCW8395852.1 aldo/keto reductase [Legionella sp. PATHC039]HAT7072924.1 aldo/keto reductase [Legionella pneumophila]HAT8641677.1 aldo/keto reductase [Legionella pneumophila]HAT8867402.1 aldo/keto reductase [Legionella pneumophila subsp. pneumophila]
MDLGFPTFIYGTAWKEKRTSELVELALTTGFQGIDTANQRKHYYEEGVGYALQQYYKKSGILRDDIFLQSKFTYAHGQDHRKPYDDTASLTIQAQQSFASSLEHLNTDYLNSYILHGPYYQYNFSDEDKEVWNKMESLHKDGKVKHLGISNVSYEQLIELISFASVKPKFVQNRCFARVLWDKQIRNYCQAHGIIYQGFSLLTANQYELRHPKLENLSKKYEKSIEQIIFRFSQQIGMLPLTGTTNLDHMKEDLAIHQFSLTDDEINFIENIAFIP